MLETSTPPPRTRRTLWRVSLWGGLLLGACLLFVTLAVSLALGAADITVASVYNALVHFDGSFDHLIIRTVRLPRILAGALVGAALAVAGAIMQGVTRNPLSDPGILGIEAGAAFAVVLGVLLLGSPPLSTYALLASVGAVGAALFVYLLGGLGRGGATPLKLTLAGAVLTAFISSFTSAILILNQDTLEQVRFWTAGSLAGRDLALVGQTAPYMITGLFGAMLLGWPITLLSLGDEVAVGLGLRTGWLKILCAAVVVLLAGGAVALAGPVGFVGLVVPHIVRMLIGTDYRWILPYSALGGAMLVTLADIGARLVIRPLELPVGVVMALLGAPFFIYLARFKVKR